MSPEEARAVRAKTYAMLMSDKILRASEAAELLSITTSDLNELCDQRRLGFLDFSPKQTGHKASRRFYTKYICKYLAGLIWNREPGRVYFITNGKYVKTGYTQNVEKRLAALQTAHHLALRVYAVIENTIPLDERRLHEPFSSLRVNGEWFRFTRSIKAFVEPRQKRDAALEERAMIYLPKLSQEEFAEIIGG